MPRDKLTGVNKLTPIRGKANLGINSKKPENPKKVKESHNPNAQIPLAKLPDEPKGVGRKKYPEKSAKKSSEKSADQIIEESVDASNKRGKMVMGEKNNSDSISLTGLQIGVETAIDKDMADIENDLKNAENIEGTEVKKAIGYKVDSFVSAFNLKDKEFQQELDEALETTSRANTPASLEILKEIENTVEGIEATWNATIDDEEMKQKDLVKMQIEKKCYLSIKDGIERKRLKYQNVKNRYNNFLMEQLGELSQMNLLSSGGELKVLRDKIKTALNG